MYGHVYMQLHPSQIIIQAQSLIHRYILHSISTYSSVVGTSSRTLALSLRDPTSKFNTSSLTISQTFLCALLYLQTDM
jgi:hypothetical protein